ncbi:MAG: lamin tail domain-containing protein, partial [Thermoproteota archaeon]
LATTTAGNIVINEVELNPQGADSGAEQIELYNPSDSAVDVGGWSLGSTAGSTVTITIDEGTVIPSKGHLLIGRASQWLDNVDEGIILRDDTGATIDTAGTFSDEDNDDSTWQRSPDGADSWIFASGTPGEANIGTFVPEPEPEAPSPSAEEPAPAPEPQPDLEASSDELKLVVIDVGQGLSELIILPNGKTMLIDGGDRNQGDAVLSALQENGVDSLDVVVATHPHSDHIGGMIDVLNTIEVRKVLDSGQIHTTQTFEDYLDAIDSNQIPLASVHEGDTIDLDPAVQLEVLNPPTTLLDGADDEEEFNNNSVVIKLTYGEFTAILPGDMEEENEARLASSSVDLDADVLVAGHHGSRTASTSAFLNAVSPAVVLISLGAGNTYGHPHQEALDRMEAAGTQHILMTDIDGTITITTTGDDEYTIRTSGSNKTVVVPEFGTAILIAAISLMALIVLYSRAKLWKSSGLV